MKKTIKPGHSKKFFSLVFTIILLSFSPLAFAAEQESAMNSEIINQNNIVSGTFNKITPISEEVVLTKSERINLYQYWVNNPVDCPTTHDDYPGFSCDTLDICGDSNGAGQGGAQCYDTSTIPVSLRQTEKSERNARNYSVKNGYHTT